MRVNQLSNKAIQEERRCVRKDHDASSRQVPIRIQTIRRKRPASCLYFRGHLTQKSSHCNNLQRRSTEHPCKFISLQPGALCKQNLAANTCRLSGGNVIETLSRMHAFFIQIYIHHLLQLPLTFVIRAPRSWQAPCPYDYPADKSTSHH